MQIIVTDRDSIEHGIVVRTSYVVISISNPGHQRAKVKKTSGLKDVLYLSFHDAEPVDGFRHPPDIKIMTTKHAVKIWDFLSKHKDQVGAIVVHCHQGMSRSPAIAAAIARSLGQDTERFWEHHQPNQFIYELMIETRKKPSTAK